ncbi:hypothetical protein ACWGR4_10345 [Embleya sp. NPDC055664]
MSTRSKNLFIILVSGLVPAVLGAILRLPLWAWVSVTVVVVGCVALLRAAANSTTGHPAGTSRHNPPAAPTVPPYQQTRVERVALPSCVSDYDFMFSATVMWRPVRDVSADSHISPASLAVSALLGRARAIVGREHPEHCDFAGHLLRGALGEVQQDPSGAVIVLAIDVTLTLDAADVARLRDLSTLRKSEEAWEYQRQYERNQQAYLRDEVLKSTGSAVVWWLARHEEEVEKAVALIGPLARISAAANDAEVSELYRHLVAASVDVGEAGGSQGLGDWVGGRPDVDAVDGFSADSGASSSEDTVIGPLVTLLAGLGLSGESDQRTVFVDRIARSMEAAGRFAEAERIRRRFDIHKGDDDARRSSADETPSGHPHAPTGDPESPRAPRSERTSDSVRDRPTDGTEEPPFPGTGLWQANPTSSAQEGSPEYRNGRYDETTH